jgi:hypothetical protein
MQIVTDTVSASISFSNEPVQLADHMQRVCRLVMSSAASRRAKVAITGPRSSTSSRADRRTCEQWWRPIVHKAGEDDATPGHVALVEEPQ